MQRFGRFGLTGWLWLAFSLVWVWLGGTPAMAQEPDDTPRPEVWITDGSIFDLEQAGG